MLLHTQMNGCCKKKKKNDEKMWKVFQRTHSGFKQRNQITHTEHLCVMAKAKARPRKKIWSL